MFYCFIANRVSHGNILPNIGPPLMVSASLYQILQGPSCIARYFPISLTRLDSTWPDSPSLGSTMLGFLPSCRAFAACPSCPRVPLPLFTLRRSSRSIFVFCGSPSPSGLRSACPHDPRLCLPAFLRQSLVRVRLRARHKSS